VRKSFYLLTAFVFSFTFLLTFFSCKKTARDIMPMNTDTLAQNSDSLTQNIYTIDSTASPSKGIILVSPYDSLPPGAGVPPGLLLIMDQSGKVLHKLTTPGTAYDLNRWVINGKTRYTYFVTDPSDLQPLGGGQISGYVVVADSNLNQLQRVNFTPFAQGLFPSNQGLDVHDFILLSDSDYITLAYAWEFPTNIPARLSPAAHVSVVSPIIEEVRNGAVVWHWDASSDTTFYGSSIFDNNFSDTVAAQDYIHMNSLFVDPRDNNLICSMRDQNQIIKINRQTGAIMWRLGGTNSDFAMTPQQVFLGQHHATLTDSNQTLLLFDDGNPLTRPYSRVLEFQLDEVNKVVTGFKAFNIPEPFTDYTGSVQKIGPDYFIGGGTAAYVLDVNYTTGQKVIEFKGNADTYRAFKY
jgi:arylsulfate sulfotransferase